MGEGPLWHPERSQLYWFDILQNQLLTRSAAGPQTTTFDRTVSAAGWVDENTLLIASDRGFLIHDLQTGQNTDLAPLEADQPHTRSNDGRADPWGGFWIGTMGRKAEPKTGAIYRLYQGEVRKLRGRITIPNAICFSPDGLYAYFTDTPTQIIHRQPLDQTHGWPKGDPVPLINLQNTPWIPDGAVTDAAGTIWNAQWGGFRVAAYAPDGTFLRAIQMPAAQTTCPAFGAPWDGGRGALPDRRRPDGQQRPSRPSDLTTLYCTSAADGVTADHRKQHPSTGQTFALSNVAQGVREHQVIL
nr:SMP-30/gluconolactonase/LRE family protein [Actibacterium sp. 188UL27-1]